MPKYTYRCTTCGHEFEVVRSFSEHGEPVACPHDGAACEQQFTPPTFFSKGDRFEQAATARAHWAAKGQGTEIAGHGPDEHHHGHGHGGHGHAHGPDTHTH